MNRSQKTHDSLDVSSTRKSGPGKTVASDPTGPLLVLPFLLFLLAIPFRPASALDRDLVISAYQGIGQEGDVAAEGPYNTQLAQLLTDFRRPAHETDLRFWLENMAVFHRFTTGEISAATGLTLDKVDRALRQFDLAGRPTPASIPGQPLRVLPYPGGRHPRLGFLEGAILPQRETKISVFTPWDNASYVVVDVPEAIWSNLGLTYLAHTHIPTIWDQQGLTLPPLEWTRLDQGELKAERTLPNGIAFGTRVVPTPSEVRMELWLRNGTPEKLTGLRVQNCVMLKAAPGFAAQTVTNKIFQPPYGAVRSHDGSRWVITGWDPCDRCWGNDQVPCLHADPKFADCPPGQIVRLRGWLSFYQGTNLSAELRRIDRTDWRKMPANTNSP
jgi:hypothetical protein